MQSYNDSVWPLAIGDVLDLFAVSVAPVERDMLVAESSVPNFFDAVTRSGRAYLLPSVIPETDRQGKTDGGGEILLPGWDGKSLTLDRFSRSPLHPWRAAPVQGRRRRARRGRWGGDGVVLEQEEEQ